MPGDPTQVDWNYQVSNRPASLPPSGPAGGDLSGTYPDPTVAKILNRALDMTGIGVGKVLTWSGSVWHPVTPLTGGMTGIFQINPNAGTFTGTTLTVDHARGFIATSGPNLSMELASLSQIGVIGAAEQYIQGPVYFTGADRNFGHPHDPLPGYSAIIKDGWLGLYDSSYDGTSAPLAARIDWGITTPRVFTVFSNEGLTITNNGFGAPLKLISAGAGSHIFMDNGLGGITMLDPNLIAMTTGSSPTTSANLTPAFAFSTVRGFNLTGSAGGHPLCYGIGGVAGVYGTQLDGSTVAGGIITAIGSTHVGGPPTGAAGGDLTGSYPNPTIAKLQTITLTATGGSSGNVLTFSGGTWHPAAIPLQVSLIQAGGEIQVDGAGDLMFDPVGGGGIEFFGVAVANQQTALGTTAGFTANATANFVFAESTFDGGLGGSAYTLGDVVRALKNYGLLAM